MTSATVSEATTSKDRWRRKLRLCFLGVHLVGLVAIVLGYRLWLYPTQERLSIRAGEATGAGIRTRAKINYQKPRTLALPARRVSEGFPWRPSITRRVGSARKRQVNLARFLSMQVNYALWEAAEREGQKEWAKNFAAHSFGNGMKEMSPRLAAYFEAVSEYDATGMRFSVLYTAAAILVVLGLIGCVAASVKGSWW